MIDSAARVVAKYLKDVGLASSNPSLDWFVTAGTVPQQGRDNLLTVFDTFGVIHGKTADDGEVVQHHGVQVRIRSADYETGAAKAWSLINYLSGLKNVTTTIVYGTTAKQYTIHSFGLTSGPAKIAEEEVNQRQIFTFNGLVAIS